MRIISRVIQVLYSIYAMLVFVILMLALFPFIVLASLLGPVQGGNLIYRICVFWADAAMFLWGMHHHNIYETKKPGDHPVVFIFNHISYLDIPVLLKAFRGRHFRVLGKAEMAGIPIFGFIYRKAAIMVDRSSAQARAKSVLRLKSAIHEGMSIVLAPEGTFNMTHKPLKEFYDGAFRIAIETGTPIQPVIFLDLYDRLNYKSVFSFTPGRTRAVFLPELPVEGLDEANIQQLKQKAYSLMEDALIRYKATWIGHD